MMACFFLLAKRDLHGAPPVSWQHLQEQWSFSAKHLMPVTPILVVVVLLTTVMILIGCWRSGIFRRLRPTSLQIFRQVIHDLGLARGEVSLLIRIAHHQHLPSPLTLMLSAATLEHHAQAYAQSIAVGSHRRGQFDIQIGRIKEVVFGSPKANMPETHP